MKYMDNLISNLKVLLSSISIFGLISSAFKFIFTTLILLVYVTIVTIFIVQYELILIISRVYALITNILNSANPFF